MSTAPDIGLQLVPVTPAVAALLHQLQQEAIEANPAPEPGSIVLAPPGPVWSKSHQDTSSYAYFNEGSIWLYRTWSNAGATWTGEESRNDAEGRRWTRRIEAVMDDCGDLVEVAS